MVATSAFGMGIDLPDIDLVLHFNMPFSMNDYTQQTGRAGRDGRKAHCILLYGDEDFWTAAALVEPCGNARLDKSLRQMVNFCNDRKHCLKKLMAEALGQETGKTADSAPTVRRGDDDMDCTVFSGIHTVSFSKALTGAAYYRILHSAQKQGVRIHADDDYFSATSSHTLLGYQKQGVVVYLSQPKRTVYKVKLRIEPERVLGNSDPQALWQCQKGGWKRLVQAVDGLTGALGLPSLREMTLSVLELTVNLVFPHQEYVDAYIQILKKGCLNGHYKRVWFDKHAGKAKNVQEANRHSCKVTCKQKSFFAYDKTAQLLMTERIDRLPDHRTLRMEVSLKREAIKKEFGANKTDRHYLEHGSAQAQKLVRKFLKKLLLNEGNHLPYDEAIERVQQLRSQKTGQRAEQLIRLCSRKKSVDQAVKAMQEEYGIKRSAVDRVIKKLNGLNINPITIPIRRHAQPLPSLLTLLK